MRIAEDELIDRIRRRLPSSTGGTLRLGIGHDAAVFRPMKKDWVVTCDQFLEGAHFTADKHPPDSVGYKALARATSDVLAMGAKPRLFLLSIALPSDKTGHWLDQMLSGMSRACRILGLRLAGGDTARSPQHSGVALNVMVLGETPHTRVIGRAGAGPGDGIYVTGVLGRAQLGLELLMRGVSNRRKYARLLAQHLYPSLPLDLAVWLGRNRFASAMMDLSDGLSTDVGRFCRASRIAANIHADRIPAVPLPRAIEQRYGLDRLTLALNGGEDYGLLFTIPKRFESRIPKIFRRTRITRIGDIVRGSGVRIVMPDGHASPLAPHGWDHFANP